ncbi:vesicular, overexpressed in cancer, prosurvival protein 1-like isoform X1 [Mya arenaria]|uniref:vesicular, overexpressed in cancer, prosurvival protein 1-like isoform X1 n=1 Tax=Mya arenaria TaxID=6604 RepID=UPI0022E5CD56|nr:vesicular, overexpressed in cancer, prosurvival protein 1-like isoform X1 [Mya arenaria]
MASLLIFLVILLIEITECKYCWYKSGFGKSSHFYCSAFQYCCGDKCCENIDEFYKLWYFWLCILVLILSAFVAFYWLRNHYGNNRSAQEQRSRSHRRSRSGRRYRQLTGDSVTSAPSVIIPDSVVTAPPPYMGDNTGCPHLGPPPYFLGSGSSINSQPRFPPPYSKIEKQPPPSYSSTVEIDVVDSNGAIHGKSEKNNDRSDDNSSS